MLTIECALDHADSDRLVNSVVKLTDNKQFSAAPIVNDVTDRTRSEPQSRPQVREHILLILKFYYIIIHDTISISFKIHEERKICSQESNCTFHFNNAH